MVDTLQQVDPCLDENSGNYVNVLTYAISKTLLESLDQYQIEHIEFWKLELNQLSIKRTPIQKTLLIVGFISPSLLLSNWSLT